MMYYRNAETCVCCGAVIPEGTMYCIKCGRKYQPCLHVWVYEDIVLLKKGSAKKCIQYKCAKCGKTRIEETGQREGFLGHIRYNRKKGE